MHGYTRQVRAPEGKVNITLNSDEDGLLEIFVNVGKAGSDIAALAEAVGRLVSLHLRIDSPLSQDERAREIARQLQVHRRQRLDRLRHAARAFAARRGRALD